MMIRLIRLAFLVTVLLQGRAALAQELKIAVVNLQQLTTATEEGKKVNEKLEARYMEVSAELQKLSRAIEDKENNLRTQARALSAARSAQLATEIEDDKVRLKRKTEDYQREMAEMEQKLMGPIVELADQILGAYVKERNFTLLVNWATENGNLVWYNPANDITNEVVKLINAQPRPAGTAVAPAPPSAKPPAQTPPASNREP